MEAMDLAKYIVNKCINDDYPISNLQLQKILYYIQKDFLDRDEKAFDDSIEAWQFGPVVPEVYYHYCGYGAMPISMSFGEDYDEYLNELENKEDVEKINKIVEEKRKLDPWTMVAETHKKGGAWDKTYNNGLGNHAVIQNELIKTVG